MDNRRVAVAVAVVVIIAAGAYIGFDVLPARGGGSGQSTCTTCTQPVVDVVMPALGTSGNFTNPNRVVNMTSGEARTFEVDVYPTSALGFTMTFGTILAPGSGTQGGGQGISAIFYPSNFTVGANSKGATFMTLTVAQGAAKGTYDVVVSATNQADSAEVWGLYFEVSVS